MGVGGINLNFVLDRTVSVERATTAADEVGATDREPWTTLVRGLRAAIVPAADRVVQSYARRELQIDYSAYVVQDLAKLKALRGDLMLNDRLNDKGTLYIVQGFKAYRHAFLPFSGAYEIHCLRIPG